MFPSRSLATTDWPTASSSIAWKCSSSSLLAKRCTSLNPKNKNQPPLFTCSSRLRHWLHSSEAPRYGGELLSLCPAVVVCCIRSIHARQSLAQHFGADDDEHATCELLKNCVSRRSSLQNLPSPHSSKWRVGRSRGTVRFTASLKPPIPQNM